MSGAAAASFVYDGDGKRVKETNACKNLAKGIVVTGSAGITNPDVITNGDTQADNGSGGSQSAIQDSPITCFLFTGLPIRSRRT